MRHVQGVTLMYNSLVVAVDLPPVLVNHIQIVCQILTLALVSVV